MQVKHIGERKHLPFTKQHLRSNPLLASDIASTTTLPAAPRTLWNKLLALLFCRAGYHRHQIIPCTVFERCPDCHDTRVAR